MELPCQMHLLFIYYHDVDEDDDDNDESADGGVGSDLNN